MFGHIIAISKNHKTIDVCSLKELMGLILVYFKAFGFYQVLLNGQKDLFVRRI